jgi:hypothetical protein
LEAGIEKKLGKGKQQSLNQMELISVTQTVLEYLPEVACPTSFSIPKKIQKILKYFRMKFGISGSLADNTGFRSI